MNTLLFFLDVDEVNKEIDKWESYSMYTHRFLTRLELNISFHQTLKVIRMVNPDVYEDVPNPFSM